MMKKIIGSILCLTLIFALLCPTALAVGSTVKLTADLTVDATIVIETDTSYDLNGYTLALAANASGSVFFVKSGATLSIMDSSPAKTGKITGGNALNGMAFEASELGFNRGEYRDDTDGCGGGVYAESGAKLVMTGGTLTGNRAEQGGGIYLESGAELHVSGTASVIGNYSDADGKTADNVFLPLDENDQQSAIFVDAPLSANARIGITPAVRNADGVTLTSGMKGNGVKINLIADESGKSFYANDNGEVAFSTAAKPVPTITTLPKASALIVGQPLSKSALTGGEAEVAGTKIKGTFSWMDPSIIPVADTEYSVIFTPADATYGDAIVAVGVTLRKGTAAAPVEDETEGFVDVAAGSYYENAVDWAVEKGITTGTDATHFSPNTSCTRAQMVAFLWRAAGSPEPTKAAAFDDVAANAYYAKAVQWAAENGITLGTSATTFSPDATVTRAQTVTFLFRALKGAASGDNSFTDVAESAFYADAVQWAVANGITTGTSATKFSPANDCLRAQIVTFLYRAYNKK